MNTIKKEERYVIAVMILYQNGHLYVPYAFVERQRK